MLLVTAEAENLRRGGVGGVGEGEREANDYSNPSRQQGLGVFGAVYGLLECPLTLNLTTKLPLLSQSGCVCA